MDNLSPKDRSRLMSLVRSKDTRPEIAVRRLCHALGYRFRLHRRDLPGTPDLVFPRLHAIILVHGCFWHRHRCANGKRTPKSRVHFWKPKLENNARRDHRNVVKLRRSGWSVMIVWECQLCRRGGLECRILAFLDTCAERSARGTTAQYA